MEVLRILNKSHFWGQKRQNQVRKICIFITNQFLAVQGTFLHQLSPFLVCRLVLTLFCGSFNIFLKIPFLGSKTAKLGTENMHFQYKSVFSSAGHVSSPIIAIFGLWACYNVVLWKVKRFWKKSHFLGQNSKIKHRKYMHFQYKLVLSSDGHVSSPIIAIFGFWACYNVLLWKF